MRIADRSIGRQVLIGTLFAEGVAGLTLPTNLKIYRKVAKDAKGRRVEWVTAQDARLQDPRPKTQEKIRERSASTSALLLRLASCRLESSLLLCGKRLAVTQRYTPAPP